MSDKAAEIEASHQVLAFLRDRPELNWLVLKLRNAGQAWLEVKQALETSGAQFPARNQ